MVSTNMILTNFVFLVKYRRPQNFATCNFSACGTANSNLPLFSPFFIFTGKKTKSQCRSMKTMQWAVCHKVFQRRKDLTHYGNSEKTGSLWQDPTY